MSMAFCIDCKRGRGSSLRGKWTADSDRGRMTLPGQGKGGGRERERMVVVVGRGCIRVERALRERRFIANNCAATLFAFYPYRNSRSVSSGSVVRSARSRPLVREQGKY